MPTPTQPAKPAAAAPELAAGRAAPEPTVRRHPRGYPDDRPILSIRASVAKADAHSFIAEALHDIRVYMQEHDVAAAGPPFSICRPVGDRLDVEAGWPTTRPLTGTSRIHSGSLPEPLTGPRDNPHGIPPGGDSV